MTNKETLNPDIPYAKIANDIMSEKPLSESSKEILETAIQKAIDGGWVFIDSPDMVSFKIKQPLPVKGYPWYLFRAFNNEGGEVEVNIEHIIFNHDFAKAIWGEGNELPSGLTNTAGLIMIPRWKSCLKEMVISDDPIKYLGEHI